MLAINNANLATRDDIRNLASSSMAIGDSVQDLTRQLGSMRDAIVEQDMRMEELLSKGRRMTARMFFV